MASEKMITTRDHEAIRAWARKHEGIPAVLPVQGVDEQRLVIAFADQYDDDSEVIFWDEWFHIFDGANLQFQYWEEGESTSDRNYQIVRSDETKDVHLGPPGEANQDKHINFRELEDES